MHILLACMANSPYNRSIWTGIARAFVRSGHRVTCADSASVPLPAQTAERPDLLFAVHGGYLPVTTIDAWRAAGVPTAVYLLDEPYEVDRSREWARHYDRIYTCDRATVPLHGKNAHFLPLAFDDEVFRPQGQTIPSEILVLGSPFPARAPYLAALRDRLGAHVTWVGPGWKAFAASGQHVENFVTPELCAAFYRGALAVVNIHRDDTWSHFGAHNTARIAATHLNPRFWEAAACGAFQIITPRADAEVFVPNEVATCADPESLVRAAEQALSQPEAARERGTRACAATRDHTWLARVPTMLEASST